MIQMSEKRFSIFDIDEVEDVWNELKGTIYCYDEEEAQRCENWLNNLHNQNQKLKEENEQLRKIGVMYQGHNPCEICIYCLENKVCCAEAIPISCDDAKKNFIQGLCKKHKNYFVR